VNGSIAKKLRDKAKSDGIGIDELRVKLKLGGGTFYNLLRGDPPRSPRVVRKLREGGISVSPNVLLEE
jgi:hypothetical protein